MINWYGLLMAAGYLIGYFILRHLQRFPASKLSVDTDQLALGMSISIFVGSRLGDFILYRPQLLVEAPLQVLEVYRGGMSFHGGLASLVAYSLWCGRRYGVLYTSILDRAALCGPLGLFLGRIGNFLNSELYGNPFDGPWAIVFKAVDELPRHPSQLYEAISEGLVIFCITWWLHVRHGALKRPGLLAGTFFVLYSLARSFCEYFRAPIDGTVNIGMFSLTLGQFYCIPVALMGVVLLVRARREQCSLHGPSRSVKPSA
jgi:phosphatidylglycerol---prolipoprotein diacylglyceryl transferase